MKRRIVIKSALSWAVFMVFYWGVFLLVGDPWEFVVLGAYVGYCFGDSVGYKHGLKEGYDMVSEIWGLDTPEGRQHFLREKARWN